jgi:hypothetical protein
VCHNFEVRRRTLSPNPPLYKSSSRVPMAASPLFLSINSDNNATCFASLTATPQQIKQHPLYLIYRMP